MVDWLRSLVGYCNSTFLLSSATPHFWLAHRFSAVYFSCLLFKYVCCKSICLTAYLLFQVCVGELAMFHSAHSPSFNLFIGSNSFHQGKHGPFPAKRGRLQLSIDEASSSSMSVVPVLVSVFVPWHPVRFSGRGMVEMENDEHSLCNMTKYWSFIHSCRMEIRVFGWLSSYRLGFHSNVWCNRGIYPGDSHCVLVISHLSHFNSIYQWRCSPHGSHQDLAPGQCSWNWWLWIMATMIIINCIQIYPDDFLGVYPNSPCALNHQLSASLNYCTVSIIIEGMRASLKLGLWQLWSHAWIRSSMESTSQFPEDSWWNLQQFQLSWMPKASHIKLIQLTPTPIYSSFALTRISLHKCRSYVQYKSIL